MSGIENMIDKIMDKNYAGAADDFSAEMASRVSSALDDEKAAVAAEIYGEAVSEDFTDEELEEFLEALDQDDVDYICEEEGVESLDELSPATLSRYRDAAAYQARRNEDKPYLAKTQKERDTAKKTMTKRLKGLGSVTKRKIAAKGGETRGQGGTADQVAAGKKGFSMTTKKASDLHKNYKDGKN